MAEEEEGGAGAACCAGAGGCGGGALIVCSVLGKGWGVRDGVMKTKGLGWWAVGEKWEEKWPLSKHTHGRPMQSKCKN